MTKDIENPETIEINGLKTIHKLCKFGADHNMEGCSFTEIVERMFSKIEQMKTQINTLDEMLLNQGEALAQAKAKAIPEGFVVVPLEATEAMYQAYEKHSVAPMSTLSKTGYKAMLEEARGGNE